MLYARDAWYVAAWSHELDQSKPNAVMILGEPITIWWSKGEWIAMEDRCPHRFAPLSLGRCEDDHLRCMYHGLVFDKNGICLKVPGQDNVPEKMRVQTYQVREKNGWIWIWMGKSESADDTIIPDVIGPNNPDYYISTGTLDYEAEAFLISRNLLDSAMSLLYMKRALAHQERWLNCCRNGSTRSVVWPIRSGHEMFWDPHPLRAQYPSMTC